jgi:serine/threonine protein kinase
MSWHSATDLPLYFCFNSVPSTYMIERGDNAHRFFERTGDPTRRYALKSRETYSREQKKTELQGKKYFHATKLKDLIMDYALPRKGMADEEKERGRCKLEQLALEASAVNGIRTEKQNRLALIDFLQGVLKLDPIVRWSPQQAKNHPFVTGERFTGPYQPENFRRLHLPQPTDKELPILSQAPILPTSQPVMSNARIQNTFSSSQNLRPRSKTFSNSSSSSSPASQKQKSFPAVDAIQEDVTPQAMSTATDVERNHQWVADNGRDSFRYRSRPVDNASGPVSTLGQEGLKRRSTHGPSKSAIITDSNLKRSPSDVHRVKIDDRLRIRYGDEYRYESSDHISSSRRGPEADVEAQTKAGRRNTGTFLTGEPQGLIPIPDRQRDLEEGNANMGESYQNNPAATDSIGLNMVGGLLRRRASERP